MKKSARALCLSAVIALLALLVGCPTPGGGTTPPPVPGYRVLYDGNQATGGTPPSDAAKYASGDVVTVSANRGSLEKTGVGFGGWNTMADGTGISYTPGQTFSMGSADVTLYASWKPVVWGSLSLTGIPSPLATSVSFIDLHQATPTSPLFLVMGATAGSRQVHAYRDDSGSWTDISEALPPRVNANTGSLVSSISPSGEPSYWYQGSDLVPLGTSQIKTYSGGSWVIRGASPAPSMSNGEHRNLYFRPDGTPRLLYQTTVWNSGLGMYLQNLYLRELDPDWDRPSGVPEPLASMPNRTQVPLLRTAVGSSGEIHILMVYSLDDTRDTTEARYYRWDGSLTGPETIRAANWDRPEVGAIALNPVTGQPYVMTEDVGTETTRTITVSRRTAPGVWQVVGTAGALSRTTYNNSSFDLAFTPDGTPWAVTQTTDRALSVFRFASSWQQFTWTSSGSVNYSGMKLTRDGRICMFATSTLVGPPIAIPYLNTW